MKSINIDEVVKDNTARFSYYIDNALYFTIPYNGKEYKFPIYLDMDKASFVNEYEAIDLIEYIRQSIENGTFVQA